MFQKFCFFFSRKLRLFFPDPFQQCFSFSLLFRFPQLFFANFLFSLLRFLCFFLDFLSDLFQFLLFCKNALFLFCQFFSLLFQPVLFPYGPNPQFSFRICKFFCDFRSRKFIYLFFHRFCTYQILQLLLPISRLAFGFRSCFLLILFCPDRSLLFQIFQQFLFLFLPSLPIALQYFKTAPHLLQPLMILFPLSFRFFLPCDTFCTAAHLCPRGGNLSLTLFLSVFPEGNHLGNLISQGVSVLALPRILSLRRILFLHKSSRFLRLRNFFFQLFFQCSFGSFCPAKLCLFRCNGLFYAFQSFLPFCLSFFQFRIFHLTYFLCFFFLPKPLCLLDRFLLK